MKTTNKYILLLIFVLFYSLMRVEYFNNFNNRRIIDLLFGLLVSFMFINIKLKDNKLVEKFNSITNNIDDEMLKYISSLVADPNTPLIVSDLKIINKLDVEGNSNLKSKLNVNGNTTLKNKLNVNGDTKLKNKLNVDNKVTFNDMLKFTKHLQSNEKIIDFDLHKKFDIRRHKDGKDWNADLILNSENENEGFWGIGHNGATTFRQTNKHGDVLFRRHVNVGNNLRIGGTELTKNHAKILRGEKDIYIRNPHRDHNLCNNTWESWSKRAGFRDKDDGDDWRMRFKLKTNRV